MENGKKQYQTAGRTALLAYLKEKMTGAPETAEEIYRGMAAGQHAPGRSSVYRLLGELAADGTVRKSRATGAGFVYQLAGERGDCGGHLHLQCLSCGKVSHLKCACGDAITSNLMKTHGFLVDRGRSVLFGTCADCAKGGGTHA